MKINKMDLVLTKDGETVFDCFQPFEIINPQTNKAGAVGLKLGEKVKALKPLKKKTTPQAVLMAIGFLNCLKIEPNNTDLMKLKQVLYNYSVEETGSDDLTFLDCWEVVKLYLNSEITRLKKKGKL